MRENKNTLIWYSLSPGVVRLAAVARRRLRRAVGGWDAKPHCRDGIDGRLPHSVPVIIAATAAARRRAPAAAPHLALLESAGAVPVPILIWASHGLFGQAGPSFGPT
jgi:hypothetical protein